MFLFTYKNILKYIQIAQRELKSMMLNTDGHSNDCTKIVLEFNKKKSCTQ